MGLILLEALLALVVLITIVWWTMFSGRKGGELDLPAQDPNPKPGRSQTAHAGRLRRAAPPASAHAALSYTAACLC